MKFSRQFIFLANFSIIFFFLFFSLSSHAQNNYSILLQSGSILPAENFESEIIFPSVLQNEIVNEKYYRILQFQEIPNQNDKESIENLGVEFLSYLPNRAYLVAIPNKFDLTVIQKFQIRSILIIKAEYKIPTYLKQEKLPSWALNAKNKIDLNISYHKNLSKKLVLQKLKNKKIEILQSDYLITVRIDIHKISELAELSFISFIEAIDDKPIPDDTRGRSLHRSSAINSPLARKYDGSGIGATVGDDGQVGPHVDFQGRIRDFAPNPGGTHGDMVSGILCGAGNINPYMTGMATGANLFNYDIGGQAYPQIRNSVANIDSLGSFITSTSYSQNMFAGGNYVADTELGDMQINRNPLLMHVFSAGNSGTIDFGYGAGNLWGNITGGFKAGKNVTACGNLNYLDVLETSSSRGPAADGRIKPDICANGIGHFSTAPNNTYRVGGGTSAACPGVAGIYAQLHHAFRIINSDTAHSALLKGCILNTAEDLGNPGPDFKHGWGRVNALRAVKILENHQYFDSTMTQGATHNFNLNVPANVKEVRIMVIWADYEGNPMASKALVNDLNFTLTAPNMMTYNPWILDPTPDPMLLDLPAVRGVDTLNNMEQITLENPISGNYNISINGFQIPQGPQQYFVVYEFVYDEINVTYPIGGEGFNPSETEVLRWDAYGNSGNFTIDYSINNGLSWTLINNSVPGDRRFYEWIVPNDLTADALIRISRAGISGVSDTTFNIIPVPENLSVYFTCTDSIRLAWDPVAGANLYEITQLGTKYMDSIAVSPTNSIILRGTNSLQEDWYSVQAISGNAKSRRAVSVNKLPGTLNCPIAIDASIERIIEPNRATFQSCHDLDSIFIKVLVENRGNNPIFNIPVSYQINGAFPIRDTIPDTLAAFSNIIHTFSVPANFSNPNVYTITTLVNYPLDNRPTNNNQITLVTTINSSNILIPWFDNFDSNSLCNSSSNCGATFCTINGGWLNEENATQDDIDFRTITGSTPSQNTGPTSDHTGGGRYLYLEASNGCNGQVAELVTPCIDLTDTSAILPQFRLWYHMFGGSMGELHIDVFHNKNWFLDVISPISGNQGNVWKQLFLDLRPYEGSVINIRIRGITGNGFESDLSIDDAELLDAAIPPTPGFTADKLKTCIGDTIILTDNSTNFPTAWNWKISPNTFAFVNGTNQNSQNPEVVFSVNGSYDIELVASNQFGSDSLNQNAFISIQSGSTIPLLETFISVFPPTEWEVENPGGTHTWQKSNFITGSNGIPTPAAFIDNFDYNNHNAEDGLISASFDLSNAQNPYLTFDLAHAQFNNTTEDALRIDISTDCGLTYMPSNYFKKAAVLATRTPVGFKWFPNNANQWRNDTVDLNAYKGHENVKIKFVAINDNGNSLFIDNINVLNLVNPGFEDDLLAQNISVFPNPSSGIFNFKISNNANQKLTLKITDVNGKVALSNQFNDLSNNFENEINLSKMANGVYFAEFLFDEKVYRIRLVKQ